MRADLQIMEKIDLYLGGEMSGAEKAAFEQQMAQDPGLKSLVNDQQLLIKTVNRQAIMADIHAVMGAGGTTAWYSSVTTWIITGLIATGLITGLIIYNLDEENQNEIVQNETLEPIIEEIESPVLIDTVEEVDVQPVVINNVLTRNNNRSTMPLMNNHPAVPTVELKLDIIEEARPIELPVEEEKPVEVEKIYRNRQASFPGGDKKMQKYFKENLKFSGTAEKKDVEANVKVNFFVYEDGRVEITDTECNLKSGRTGKPLGAIKTMFNHKAKSIFIEETYRLFRLMPIWEPATDSHGNPVMAPMEMFIDFDKDGNSSAYDLDFDNSERGFQERVMKDSTKEVNSILISP